MYIKRGIETIGRILLPLLVTVFSLTIATVMLRRIVNMIEVSGALVSAGTMSAQLGFALLALGLYVRYVENPDILYLPKLDTRQFVYGVAGTVVLFALSLVGGGLIQFLGLQTSENTVVTQASAEPMLFFYLIPIAILFIGPVEELLFRGIIQGVLREAVSVRFAVVVAGILFGVAHAGALGGFSMSTIPQMVVISSIGVILGLMYEKGKSLVIPSVAHGVYNAILFTSQWVVATGMI